jgi:hypothetical protein
MDHLFHSVYHLLLQLPVSNFTFQETCSCCSLSEILSLTHFIILPLSSSSLSKQPVPSWRGRAGRSPSSPPPTSATSWSTSRANLSAWSRPDWRRTCWAAAATRRGSTCRPSTPASWSPTPVRHSLPAFLCVCLLRSLSHTHTHTLYTLLFLFIMVSRHHSRTVRHRAGCGPARGPGLSGGLVSWHGGLQLHVLAGAVPDAADRVVDTQRLLPGRYVM